MLISIANWKKYNPRTDVKHTTWFRVENNFYADAAIFRLNCDGKMVWMTLLALASQKMRGEIDADITFISCVLQITEESVESALDALQAEGKIKIPTSRGRNARVTKASRPRTSSNRTDGRTDETDETDITTVKPAYSDSDLSVARDWLAHAAKEMPWSTKSASWTEESFAIAVAKVRRACGMSDTGMADVLKFIQGDDFWRSVALSPATLLKKSKNGNRKIDNILLRMRTQTDRDVDTIKRWAETP